MFLCWESFGHIQHLPIICFLRQPCILNSFVCDTHQDGLAGLLGPAIPLKGMLDHSATWQTKVLYGRGITITHHHYGLFFRWR